MIMNTAMKETMSVHPRVYKSLPTWGSLTFLYHNNTFSLFQNFNDDIACWLRACLSKKKKVLFTAMWSFQVMPAVTKSVKHHTDVFVLGRDANQPKTKYFKSAILSTCEDHIRCISSCAYKYPRPVLLLLSSIPKTFRSSPKSHAFVMYVAGAFCVPEIPVHAPHVDAPSHTYYYQNYDARLRCLRSRKELRLNSKTGASNKWSLLRASVTSRTRVLF